MTLEPTTCAVVSGDCVRHCLAEQPDFALHVIKKLIGLARASTEHIKRLALDFVHGRATKQPKALSRDGLTQRGTAERARAPRERVNRVFMPLAESGCIDMQGSRIALLEPLTRLAAQLAEPEQVLALAADAVAALLVIVSAFVRLMIPLRWLPVASDVGFIVYGLLHPAPLRVVLHAVLLPVKLWRVWQMTQLTRRVNASAADAQQLQIWLRPCMRSRRCRAGQTVFSSSDLADRLYFVAARQLQVQLPEVGRTLTPRPAS